MSKRNSCKNEYKPLQINRNHHFDRELCKMGSTLKCYICDFETNKRNQQSLFDVRTRYSNKPVVELLKRFQTGDGTIQARDGSNICVLCDDCIDEINAYDEAYHLAAQIEEQLKEILILTAKRYRRGKDILKIPEQDQMNVNQIARDPVLNPNVVVAEPFETFEMDGTSLGFQDNNDAGSASISETEEKIESEEDDFDSDDSFVWSRNSNLKQKQERKNNMGISRQRRHIYSCIECPAHYCNKLEMQV